MRTDPALTRGQRFTAIATTALIGIAGIAGPVSAAGVVDSGFTCGKTTFTTWSWGIPTRWTYQGTTGLYGAHKHRWNGDRWQNGTTDYYGYLSAGWCADAH